MNKDFENISDISFGSTSNFGVSIVNNMNENSKRILKCKKCNDSPRIIFDTKENEIVIRTYCLSHKNDEKITELKHTDDFEFFFCEDDDNDLFNKDENNENNIQSYLKPLICEKHSKINQNFYIKYCINDKKLLCQYCYEEEYDKDKEYESISDLLTMFESYNDEKKNKRHYIKMNFTAIDNHLNNINKNHDKTFGVKGMNEANQIDKKIDEYMSNNISLYKICQAMFDTYEKAYKENRVTYSMIKNVSQLNFNIVKCPEYFFPNERENKLYPYLNNINNNIVTHHLKKTFSKCINVNGPCHHVILLNENRLERRLCVSVTNNNGNELLILKLSDFSILDSINVHKNEILKIGQLNDNTLISLSKERCVFIELNEREHKKVHEFTEPDLCSFLILQNKYIVIQKEKCLKIYELQSFNCIKTEDEFYYNNIETCSQLLFNSFYKDKYNFYSIPKKTGVLKAFSFDPENKSISTYKEAGYEFSGFNQSYCEFINNFFILGGRENSGFYINKFNDNKNYTDKKPNNYCFQAICVTNDGSFITGECYQNRKFAMRRYQIYGRALFHIDDILYEENNENTLKPSINCIIKYEDKGYITVDGKGFINLFN